MARGRERPGTCATAVEEKFQGCLVATTPELHEALAVAEQTWDSRERPLLEAIARAEEEDRSINNDDLAVDTGLDRHAVDRGLLALVEASYVGGIDAAAEEVCYLLDIRLRERGRRAVDQWPSENPGEELLKLLAHRVEIAETAEERSRWQRVLEAARGLGGKAVTEVTIALLKREAGL